MHRPRCLVPIGALAVVVSVVAAGPAVAAKGGNNDTAHACQQGGHQNRFEAETGNPFRNAGDCASHGAKSGAFSSLQVEVTQYPENLWGIVNASGLQANSQVTILDQNNDPTRFFVFADQYGNLDRVMAALPCGSGAFPEVSATGTTSQGQTITSPEVGSPCG